MTTVEWTRYPRVAEVETTRRWLSFQANRGLADNTIQAYGRALEDYLRFCQAANTEVLTATREGIARYVRDLQERPEPLSLATTKQRLTAVRLYYDFLVEEGLRDRNPVGRGQFVPGQPAAAKRGWLPTYYPLPWIPTEEEWQQLVVGMQPERLRNRFMFALCYDAALRRGELCSLQVSDIDPAYRQIHIRAENAKNHRARIVQYSEETGVLYQAYLRERRQLSRARGLLFLSESKRNRAAPVTLWSWSKIVRAVAQRTGLEAFTPHTLRHLRLTDLARAGWDIHLIAQFAGHRNLQTTMQYIHLSGRDIAAQLQRGMADIHAWRMRTLGEALP